MRHFNICLDALLRRALCLLAALVLLAPSTTSAGISRNLTREFLKEHWSKENGFPGGQVNAIAQTRDGFLWIGTDNGLYRYDGISFVSSQALGATSPIAHVLGLAIDDAGELCVRMRGFNLLHYANGSFRTVLPDEGLPDRGVMAMAQGRDDSVLVTTMHRGIYRYRRHNLEQIAAGAAGINALIISIAETADGTLWLGTYDHGLFALRGKTLTAIHEGVPERKINTLQALDDGSVLVGTDIGAIRLRTAGTRYISTPQPVGSNQILATAVDRTGGLWFGTGVGLIRTENSTDEVTTRQLLSNEVTALLPDRQGFVWVGTTDGLFRFRPYAFKTFSTDLIGPVYADTSGAIWFAPERGRLYRMARGMMREMAAGELKNDVVMSISGAGQNVWIVTRRGKLLQLSAEGAPLSVQRIAFGDLCAVTAGSDGSVWAGSLSEGAIALQAGHLARFNTTNGLPSDTACALTQDAGGTTWLGTPRGLIAMTHSARHVYTERDGLPADNVLSLLSDADRLWIGTSSGLAMEHDGHIVTVRNSTALLHASILAMATDSSGLLWISTFSGLYSVDRRAALRGELRERDIRSFDGRDGLRSSEGIRRQTSILIDQEKNLWVATRGGLSFARLSDVDSAPARITPEIVSVLADDQPLTEPQTIGRFRSIRRLMFRFTAANPDAPSSLYFQYKLNGLDSEWSMPSQTQQAVYTNLQPGTYRFGLRSSNKDGSLYGEASELTFGIRSVFWRSAWFFAGCVCVLAATVWVLLQLRMRQLTRKMNQRFAERLSERTALAQELHDTLLQGFLGASFQLHLITDRIPDDSPSKPDLNRLLTLMSGVSDEGRNALRGLVSLAKQPSDLRTSFATLLTEMNAETSLSSYVREEGAPRTLHPIVGEEVYRIGREAIVNAIRHASPQSVEVILEYSRDRFHLMVRDDGIGIAPSIVRTGREGHWGLSGMRERAERIGAELTISTGSAMGTAVRLSIPGKIAFRSSPRSLSKWKLSGK